MEEHVAGKLMLVEEVQDLVMKSFRLGSGLEGKFKCEYIKAKRGNTIVYLG